MKGRPFYVGRTCANFFTVILSCTATKATVLISNYISFLLFNTLKISDVPKSKACHKL